MSIPYMPLYWGDYLGDTQHLTAIEHGGYLLLIAHYWRTGGIPSDEIKLARICRMTTKEWNRHGSTIMEFFKDGKHSRIDAELEKVAQKTEKMRRSAQKRWNVEPEAKSLESLKSDDAKALPMQSRSNDNQNQNQNHNKNNNNRSASLAGFDDFWKAYPRKVAKGSAVKAWRTAIKKANVEEIIRATEKYKWPDDPKFIPHPATWLNAERWADVEGTPKPTFVPSYRPPPPPPPPEPEMSPEHRARMAARFNDLLASLGKSKGM